MEPSLSSLTSSDSQHTYNVEITRRNPACFLFLIDQSSSMAQPFGTRSEVSPTLTKAAGVAQALNDLLRNLIITSSKSDGIRNYFEVGIIGYGKTVGFAWQGALAGSELVPIRDVAHHFIGVNDGVDGEPRHPVWVAPTAEGSTLMCDGIRLTHSVLESWVFRNRNSFPPVVVHITDGEATDGDPGPLLAALRELGTAHGRVILFNVHLSSNRGAAATSFPDSAAGLPDPFARMLFEQSSLLTPFMRTVAWDQKLFLTEQARAFVLNADPSLMVLALEIGTRPGKLW